MRTPLFIIVACFVFSMCFSAFALDQPVRLSQANRLSTMGKEFYLSFPSVDYGGHVAHTLLYMACPVDCNVIVESNNGAFTQTLRIKANELLEYEIPTSIAFLFKGSWLTPAPVDQVYPGHGVHVSAEFPITVTAVDNCKYTAETFIVYPVESLGTEYICATANDQSWVFGTSNNVENRPAQILIVATENETKVDITLGGNAEVTTMAGLTNGGVAQVVLNRGDVYFMATKRKPWNGDMSGTVIRASHRVAVICGHLDAFIPATQVAQVDYIVEMQVPTFAWGKTLLVPRNIDDKNSYAMKLFASSANAPIHFNGSFSRVIQTAGGKEGTGYISQYTNGAANVASCYSSTKPIAMTVFGASEHPDAYQMNIVSAEQFSPKLYCVPSSNKHGYSFSDNRIGVVFQLSNDGTIPDDLEMAFPKGEEWEWQKFSSIAGSAVPIADVFNTGDNSKRYAYKELLLNTLGTFCLRSNTPIGCYSHGSDQAVGFGTPAAHMMLDLRFASDTQAPKVSFVRTDSSVDGKAIDGPADQGVRSNLAKLFLNYGSTNVSLTADPILSDSKDRCNWSLLPIDPEKEGRAYLTVCDRSGNDTTLEFVFPARVAVTRPVIHVNTTSLCVGDTLIMYCDSGYQNLKWSTGDTSRLVRMVYTKASTVLLSLSAHTLDGRATDARTVQVQVNPLPAEPLITQTANTLRTFAQTNAAFRWYDADKKIENVESEAIEISHSGLYTVQVTNRLTGCTNTSSIQATYIVSDVASEQQHPLHLHPQPCVDVLTIQGQLLRGDLLTLYNVIGEVQLQTQISYDMNSFPLDLSSLSTGVYILELRHNAQRQTIKLIHE